MNILPYFLAYFSPHPIQFQTSSRQTPGILSHLLSFVSYPQTSSFCKPRVQFYLLLRYASPDHHFHLPRARTATSSRVRTAGPSPTRPIHALLRGASARRFRAERACTAVVTDVNAAAAPAPYRRQELGANWDGRRAPAGPAVGLQERAALWGSHGHLRSSEARPKSVRSPSEARPKPVPARPRDCPNLSARLLRTRPRGCSSPYQPSVRVFESVRAPGAVLCSPFWVFRPERVVQH